MAIAARDDILLNLAKGNGVFLPLSVLGSSSGTAAAATSGFFTISLITNGIGTTYPGTLQGYLLPAGLPAELLTAALCGGSNTGRPLRLARLYNLGTLNLAATGNQFTHDAAFTGPLLRKRFGQASQAVPLIPVLYVTTATTTTAAVFQLKTNAGGAGYVNQDGNSVIGTKSFTMPAAATAVQSGFVLRLEDGDSGLRDLTQINVATAAAAGAATIYGMELLAPLHCMVNGSGLHDAVFGGLSMADWAPAAPTTGSVTSLLAIVSSIGGSTPVAHAWAALNV